MIMKKVWILEKFYTHEEMVQNFEEMKAMVEEQKKDETEPADRDKLDRFIEKFRIRIEENPNGRWGGFEGKSIYYQFCDVAKAAIRRNPNAKFRVVEGEIPDDAKFWTGYKFVKENEGVLRYLMATK